MSHFLKETATASPNSGEEENQRSYQIPFGNFFYPRIVI